MTDRAWLQTSELSTEPRRENEERSLFVQRCGRRAVIRVRICLIAAIAAVAGLTPVASAADAAAGVDAEAPPPLTKSPRLLHFVAAERPPSLADDQRADVVLIIDVDDKGRVADVAVAQSAGTEVDRAATAAARQFQFDPGEAAGKPVPVRITFVYHFLPKPPAPKPPAGEATPSTPTAPLAGIVRRKGDRAPLPGVAVIAGGAARAVTGDDGRFAFPALPVGTLALQLRAATTAPVDTTVTLTAGKRLEVTVYVDQKERYASIVRGRRALVETVEQSLQA